MNSSDIETRAGAAAELSGTWVTGYAAVFNSPADIAGLFIEKIAPGAFEKTIRSGHVLGLFGHDYNRVLGRQSNGTLKLSEDARGLRFDLELDDQSPEGQTAIAAIRRRDIVGCSFGFRVLEEEWFDGKDLPVRIIHEVELSEVSAVARPAYQETSVAMRAVEKAKHKAVAGTNQLAARRRIAARRARMEMAFRGI